MRKNKTFLYGGLGLVLIIIIAYLAGYRFTPASIGQKMDQQSHFTPSELVYTETSGNQAVIVTKHGQWLQCRTVHKTFGILWKEGASPDPINLNDFPDISENYLVPTLAERCDWPYPFTSMVSAVIFGSDNALDLTPQQWWYLTKRLDSSTWKSTVHQVVDWWVASAILTDSDGLTYTFYDTGNTLVVVKDETGVELGRYLMSQDQWVVVKTTLRNADDLIKQYEMSQALIEKTKQTTFEFGATLPYDLTWNVDLVKLPADQSELKALLKLDDWEVIQEPSTDFMNSGMTLTDQEGNTYALVPGNNLTLIRISNDQQKPQYVRVQSDITTDLGEYLNAKEVIVPPTQSMIDMDFAGTYISALKTLNFDPLGIEIYKLPGYRFTLTAAQSKLVKEKLKIQNWDRYDAVFTKMTESYYTYAAPMILTGSSGEALYFDTSGNKTKVWVVTKNKTEYYTMDTADCLATFEYLVSLYVPKGPTADVLKLEVSPAYLYWPDNQVELLDLTPEQTKQLKALLQIPQWKEAVNIDLKGESQLIVNFSTTTNLYVDVRVRDNQIVIQIAYYEAQEHRSERVYIAPRSIQTDLEAFLDNIPKQ